MVVAVHLKVQGSPGLGSDVPLSMLSDLSRVTNFVSPKREKGPMNTKESHDSSTCWDQSHTLTSGTEYGSNFLLSRRDPPDPCSVLFAQSMWTVNGAADDRSSERRATENLLETLHHFFHRDPIVCGSIMISERKNANKNGTALSFVSIIFNFFPRHEGRWWECFWTEKTRRIGGRLSLNFQFQNCFFDVVLLVVLTRVAPLSTMMDLRHYGTA